jgi:hypothetical protein
MSTGRRAYNLLRGYINREWDRIKSWEREDALRELGDDRPTAPSPKADEEPEKTVVYIPEGSTREQAAAHILGISEKAPFPEIRHAFVKLSKRSDPANFTEGTPECDQARDIYKKVHWAYRVLTEKMSDSEKRFGSLEIE